MLTASPKVDFGMEYVFNTPFPSPPSLLINVVAYDLETSNEWKRVCLRLALPPYSKAPGEAHDAAIYCAFASFTFPEPALSKLHA